MNLPTMCYTIHPTTNRPVLLKRGEMGYYPTSPELDVDTTNKLLGVTKAQEEAMLAGSMFGFDVPAANPDNYDENGIFRKEVL